MSALVISRQLWGLGVAAWLVVGCGGKAVSSGDQVSADAPPDSSQREGILQLDAEPLPAGISIELAHYAAISGSNVEALSGDAQMGSLDGWLHLTLLLPVGPGYRVNLSASLSVPGNNIDCTASAGPFEVRSADSAEGTAVWTCTDVGTGQLH